MRYRYTITWPNPTFNAVTHDVTNELELIHALTSDLKINLSESPVDAAMLMLGFYGQPTITITPLTVNLVKETTP